MKILQEDLMMQILEKGEIVDDWACDVADGGDTMSNGGVENVIRYGDEYYSVITDDDQRFVYLDEKGQPMIFLICKEKYYVYGIEEDEMETVMVNGRVNVPDNERQNPSIDIP